MHKYNNKIWRKAMFASLALFFGALSSGYTLLPKHQQSTFSAVFHFANNSSLLMRDYRTNQTEMNRLGEMLRDGAVVSALDSIVIEGSSSVTGSFQINARLSYERALAVKSYIRWKFPDVDEGKIFIKPTVFNWDYLLEQVRHDRMIPHRDDVLSILTLPLNDESKLMQIKLLGAGETENYITNNFARYMRSGTSVVFYIKVKEERSEKEEIRPEVILMPAPPPEESAAIKEKDAVTAMTSSAVMKSKPLFAIKTNLLYDMGTAANAEIEIPIGERWSLATEWVFPWWLWEKEQYALEILNGNLELRYWWGDRNGRKPMTGWYTGAYGGGGYYDVEWKTKGYQGEFISAGFTGGFAHGISKNWRMEYSLGIGYMGTKYREYIPEKCGEDDQWHLIRKSSGNFLWVGPTKLKVSLVLMINNGYHKRGGE